jgi:hypothetical protein
MTEQFHRRRANRSRQPGRVAEGSGSEQCEEEFRGKRLCVGKESLLMVLAIGEEIHASQPASGSLLYSLPRSCMPTTRLCRCWRQAWPERRRRGSGLMCPTTALPRRLRITWRVDAGSQCPSIYFQQRSTSFALRSGRLPSDRRKNQACD